MDSRERTVRAIERTGPDRIPLMYTLLPGAVTRYGPEEVERIQQSYPADLVAFGYARSEEFGGGRGIRSRDRWGAVWVSGVDGHKGQVVEHPLEDWSRFLDYVVPDPFEGEEFERAQAFIERDGGRHYLLADGDTLFQRMFYLRGIENLFIDLMEDRDEVHALRESILDYMLRRIDRWSEIGVDGIVFRDDWGSQQSLLISPSLWRSFFKPAYRRLCAAVHSGGSKVHFHSDGYIIEILPDLIEIGVDVLHPQMTVIGVARLGELFGGKVCFQTDLDRQYLLPYGTPEQLEDQARESIDAFGRFNGGIIGWAEAAEDVPLENFEAALRVFGEYRY